MEDTSTRERTVPATLPGLEDVAPSVPRPARVLGDSAASVSSEAVAPMELLDHLVAVLAEHGTARTTLDSAVTAMEDVRRLEGWLSAARLRSVLLAQRVAEENHERWVETDPSTLEGPASGGGLTRRERLAVGERSGVAEIACALRISEDAAHAQLRCAERLTTLLTATFAALENGTITARAAETIADETAEYTDALPDCAETGMQEHLGLAIEVTEASLLEAARGGQTIRQLRSRARRVRERCHPQTFAQRHAAALADRYVRVTPDGDGMARLTALLPAAVAWNIDTRLSALARQLAAQENDEPATGHDREVDRRTITQVRTDVLADLLASSPDAPPDPAGFQRQVEIPAPRVLLTVPASTLLGGDEPGWFGSFGPIPAVDARDLARRATSFMLGVVADHGGWSRAPAHETDDPPDAECVRRVDLDNPPLDGLEPACVIPVMLTTGMQYRVPTALRRALTVRDGTCRFPGCRRSAVACDVDHVTAWADGGTTVPENLAHLCRKHHVLKHHSGWSVERKWARSDGGEGSTGAGDTGDGTARGMINPTETGLIDPAGSGTPSASRLAWTSPAGRVYVTDPEPPPF